MSGALGRRGETGTVNILIYVGLLILEIAFIARAILRPHREPAARIAWVVVIAVVPIVGILAYLLFGETSIGRRLSGRAGQVLAAMPPPARASAADEARLRPEIPERYASLFRLGETINGFAPVGGNSARLLADSNATIDAMVADMDAAEDHVHLSTYIWLADGNGLKIIEALKRAAARGVTCRAIADGLGSRAMVSSSHWKELGEAGVHCAVALRVGSVPRGPSHGRFDLRNHRKIVVIDDTITYCGSQNCADPEFRIKAKYAPWIDAVMRFEGPIARQNQHVFVSDWMTYVDEDVLHLLTRPIRAPRAGFTAQVIATGPTVRYSAMPQTFELLMFAARDRLTITTPYYVPNESTQTALCAAAQRGVDTRIVFPARNDSGFVAAAS
ncbi:MAG: phospholipase D-like domain-containing protein, partial [Candidatus Binatia bacterium]